MRRRAARKAHLDGAGREHDVRPVQARARPEADDARAEGTGQLPRLPRDHARQRLADEHRARGERREGHRVQRRAPVRPARAGRRGRAGARVAPRLLALGRGRPRARFPRRQPPRRHVSRDVAARQVAHRRALDRSVAVARRRCGVAAAAGARGRSPEALELEPADREGSARLDPAQRARVRSVHCRAPDAGRAAGGHGHRGLSLVR